DDNREGVRVSFDKDNGNGWFLLRLSVHDPIMPLNIESDSQGGVEIIKAKVMSFLNTTTGLDLG
ncbi:MAG: phosphomannomutase/phosphoglucomutase, partial [Ruminococcus sp.]